MQQQLRGSEGRRGLAAYEARHRVDQRIVEPRGYASRRAAPRRRRRWADAQARLRSRADTGWAREPNNAAKYRRCLQASDMAMSVRTLRTVIAKMLEELAANLIRNKAHTNL